MNDKSPKKENKSETVKVNRDKNGRFASKDGGQKKKPEDGKVKIKVVKDKKPTDKKEKDTADGKKTVRIIRVPFLESLHIPCFEGLGSDWIDRVVSDLENSFSGVTTALEDIQKKIPEDNGISLKSFIEDVSAKKPDTLTINGHTYYSEENVAKKIEQTISTCAETASKEMEKLDALKKSQEQHQSEIHSGEKSTTAQKMAVWSANFVLWSFVFTVGIFATLGIVEVLRHFFS